MSTDPLEVVQRFYAAFGKGDREAMAALLSPTIAWSVAGPPVIPWAGDAVGPSAVLDAIERWIFAIEMQGGTREPAIVDGEHVVVRGTGRYRVRATDRVVDDRWLHVWCVVDGQIVAFTEYSDTAAAAAAFA